MTEHRALLSGIAWTGALRWFSQLISWASTLVLVRLLVPADYGIVAMAVPVISWLAVVATLGLQEAISTGPRLKVPLLRQLHGASIAIGGLLSMAVVLAALPLSILFKTVAVAPVIMSLAVSVLLEACRIVPYATLTRTLRFRETAQVDLARGLVSTLTVLTAALAGARYWALVIGQIAGAATAAGMAIRFAGFLPARPVLSVIAPVVRRSRMFLVGNVSWQSYMSMDAIIGGAVLGPQALGYLQLAKTIAFLPIEKLVSIVTAVTPGLMADSSADPIAFRRLFSNLVEGVLLVVCLPLAGLFAVADLFVPVVIGDRWIGVVGPLRLFCAAAAMAAVGGIIGQACNVLRGPRLNTLVAVAAIPASALLFHFGSTRHGVGGIAIGWIALYALLQLPLARAVLQHLGMPARDYARLYFAPGLSSGLVIASVFASRAILRGRVHTTAELTIVVVMGGAAGLTGLWFTNSPVTSSLKTRGRDAVTRLGNRLIRR